MRANQWVPGIVINIVSEYIKPHLPWLTGGCVTWGGWLSLPSTATLYDYVQFGIYGILIALLWMDLRSRSKSYTGGTLFSVEGHYYASDVRNGREYLNVRVRFTFIKNITDADVQLKVYQMHYMPKHLFTHTIAPGVNAKQDTEQTYTLAVIPLSRPPSSIEPGENVYWGSPEHPTKNFLSTGGRYIVSVCLRTNRQSQEHKFYLYMSSPSGLDFGKYFVLDERDVVIDYLTKPTVDTQGSLSLRAL